MGVPCRLAAGLALFISILSPAVSESAPIVTDLSGTPCVALVSTASPGCRIFDIANPLEALTTISGTFEADSDVALFRFMLTAGLDYQFGAHSTSYMGRGGFDPTISFYGPGFEHVEYFSEELQGVTTAVGVDNGFEDLDDRIPTFTFSAQDDGIYFLALTLGLNFHQSGLQFDWDDPRVFCGDPADAQTCPAPNALLATTSAQFDLQIEVAPVQAAPVPEPGTLSLLTLGAAAAAIVRRRRKREHRS